ncbi:hypothetical protein FF011L_23780 [Roseimaritima multifibrata]|uniref:PH domain-containing protein n=1 Tax=Roseimaritima multifibrata TaxID=1930274 RepID=A0A517MFE2_9BACT|nr:hypothetical protein [Roseimaritima multifibrata]QDS93605.1 hypothetical protein FF011L_23780 [Roseimaritima multifibrata]
MNAQTDVIQKQKRSWISAILISVVHLLAFGMLYLVLVQINQSFQEYYRSAEINLTPEFGKIAIMSDTIAAFTLLVLFAIAVDIFVVFNLASKRSRWTSGYSHAVLICMGFAGFYWTANSIGPMISSLPVVGDVPAAVAVDPAIDQVLSDES